MKNLKKIFIKDINEIIEATKQYFKNHYYVILLSISFAFLLIGIFFIIIGGHPSIIETQTDSRRLIIGGICTAIWLLTFPVLDMDKKTSIMNSLGIHSLCMAFSFYIFYFECTYFLKSKEGTLIQDILACLFGIILIAYLLYVFMSFLKIIFSYVKKAYNYFFTGNESRSTLLKKTVEAVTAYILSITAFGGSIVGIIAVVKQLIDK